MHASNVLQNKELGIGHFKTGRKCEYCENGGRRKRLTDMNMMMMMIFFFISTQRTKPLVHRREGNCCALDFIL
jgi:hypothetical protein